MGYTAGGLVASTANVNEELIIGDGVLLEKIDTFCFFLEDVLSAAGGCDSAVTVELDMHGKCFKSTHLF